MLHEKLISAAVEPIFDGAPGVPRMAAGEPVVPGAFRWRGTVYPVIRVLESGRDLGPCSHGSGERYVRRHWYRILTQDGMVMRLYFERRPRSGTESLKRWWLYSTLTGETAGPA